MPEYSGSIPTGTTVGKRWKANATAYNHMRGLPPAPPLWRLGEYVPHPEPGFVGIVWRDLHVVIDGAAAADGGEA